MYYLSQKIGMIPENKKQLRSLLGLIVGVLGVFLISLLVQKYFSPTPGFDKTMVQMASAINETCPIYVDQQTRLDNTVALPGNIFGYNYTLVNMKAEYINGAELKAMMEPTILNSIKSSPDMKLLRDNNVIFHYIYKDMSGVFIFKIIITPQQYLQNNEPVIKSA